MHVAQALASRLFRTSPWLLVATSLVACAGPAKEGAVTARAALENTALLAERGRMFAEAGDVTRAEQYLSAALANGAPPREVLAHLLRACVQGGHLRLASEYAEHQLAREPGDGHLRFLAGALQASLGSRAAAQEHLAQAAADLPRDASLQFHVAAFFRDDLKDKIAADPYFRQYLALAPKGEHAAEARASLMERVELVK
jgi:tetratricopeptide (TPR) repeat protein